MVPATALGDKRAYSANPTGKTLEKPKLLRTSNASTQPILAFWPPAAMAAAAVSDSNAPALKASPSVILMISLGSLKCFDHSRQKATLAIRLAMLTVASSVINQVVGIVRPKKIMLTCSGTQSR